MFTLEMPNQIKMNPTYSTLIYGKPGVGKTTVALSAKNPVLLDFDNGIDRVNNNFWVPRLSIGSYDEVLEFITSDAIKQFDTIVLDTMGTCVDTMTRYLLKKNPRLDNGAGCFSSWRGYGELKSTVENLLKTLKFQNKNLIFIAHEKEEDDGESRKIVRPNLGTGKGGKELLNMVDLIGYMTPENGKTIISFAPYDDRYIGKNSLQLPPRLEVPNPQTIGRNDWFQVVIDKYREKQCENVQAKRQEYEKTLSEIDGVLKDVIDAKTCNEALKYLSADDKFSKVKIWRNKLFEKSKALNLIFNEEARTFANV